MRKLLLALSLVVVTAGGLLVSGCLIDPPKAPNRVANIIKLSPKYLEALPSGMIYEGWLVKGTIDEDGIWHAPDLSEWRSFGRFNWDPYNYQPTNEAGAVIRNRFDTGVDALSFDRICITLERTADESPLPSGIVILQGEVDLLNIDADLEHPISTADIDDFDPTKNQYSIFTQSDGKQYDSTTWYDDSTSDMGLWFGNISKADRVVFDTLCRDEADSTKWFICPEGELPDTIYWCHFLDGIDTLADTTFDTITVEPIVIDTTIDTTIDTIYVVEECPDSLHMDADSTETHDTVFTIPDGDTTLAPLLTTMPMAIPGWKYQTWIIFSKSSGLAPLSLGRFSDPKGPDDDSSHCLIPTYDRHFSIPGEDFFQNVPEFGSLHLVKNQPVVEKLYITVEPDPDFDPDHPFLQLIIFSDRLPPANVFFSPGSAYHSARYTYPLVLRDVGYDLNEGHRWPEMHLDFERELIVK